MEHCGQPWKCTYVGYILINGIFFDSNDSIWFALANPLWWCNGILGAICRLVLLYSSLLYHHRNRNNSNTVIKTHSIEFNSIIRAILLSLSPQPYSTGTVGSQPMRHFHTRTPICVLKINMMIWKLPRIESSKTIIIDDMFAIGRLSNLEQRKSILHSSLMNCSGDGSACGLVYVIVSRFEGICCPTFLTGASMIYNELNLRNVGQERSLNSRTTPITLTMSRFWSMNWQKIGDERKISAVLFLFLKIAFSKKDILWFIMHHIC